MSLSTLKPLRPCALRHTSPSAAARRPTICRSAPKIAYSELKDIAQAAAEAGAKVVMEAVDAPRNIQRKGALDLVTDTDQAAEVACLSVIRDKCPGHAILGEEGGVSGDMTSDYLWCIDPLDGTTNFTHGYPSFAVSIGVLRHATPVASAVVEFVGGPKAWNTRTFTAARNHGAFCNGEALTVSRNAKLEDALLVTGFGYDHDEAWSANMELFKHFTDVTQGVRRLGAAAVDMCHVALGVADAYWEYRLKPWDVAAGVLIVEEAGGMVTTMRGTAYSVFERSVLVSNGSIHGEILKKTEPATDKLLADDIDLSPWYIPEGYSLHGGRQLD